MNKKVEVVIEGFGNRSLKKRFDAGEIRNSSIGDVVRNILDPEGSRTGSEQVEYNALMRKINTTGGRFVPSIGTYPFLDRPVEFTPIRTEAQINDYLDEKHLKENQQSVVLRIAITPAHVVAYR